MSLISHVALGFRRKTGARPSFIISYHFMVVNTKAVDEIMLTLHMTSKMLW